MATWPLEVLAVVSFVACYIALDRAVLPLDP